MTEGLTCEESDYRSDRADSVASSKSKCLSCKFSSFEGGSSVSEAVNSAISQSHLFLPPFGNRPNKFNLPDYFLFRSVCRLGIMTLIL